MRNTIKAYNNAKELLKQLDLEQKEDFGTSYDFGGPLRTLWDLNEDEEAPVKLKNEKESPDIVNSHSLAEDSYDVFTKSNAKKVIDFFWDEEDDRPALDIEDALGALDIDYEEYGEYIDDLPDEVLSKVYYFLKKKYQKDIQKGTRVPEAAYDIFNLNRIKPSIDAKKLKDELLDTLLDFYRFNNDVDLDTAEVDVKKRSEDCLKCTVRTNLDRKNLKKLTKKLDPVVQKYDENAHFDISIYSENDELTAYVWGE